MVSLVSKIDPKWIETINAVDPNWLILLWFICAIVGAVLFFMSAFIKHKNHGNNGNDIHSSFSAFLWLIAGCIMMLYNPGAGPKGDVRPDVVETLVMWTKLIVPLYVFISWPIILEILKEMSKTKLYKWVIE